MTPDDLSAALHSLQSDSPERIGEGLEHLRARMASLPEAEFRGAVEEVCSLFYVDTADRPDLQPLLDRARRHPGRAGAAGRRPAAGADERLRHQEPPLPRAHAGLRRAGGAARAAARHRDRRPLQPVVRALRGGEGPRPGGAGGPPRGDRLAHAPRQGGPRQRGPRPRARSPRPCRRPSSPRTAAPRSSRSSSGRSPTCSRRSGRRPCAAWASWCAPPT